MTKYLYESMEMKDNLSLEIPIMDQEMEEAMQIEYPSELHHDQDSQMDDTEDLTA